MSNKDIERAASTVAGPISVHIDNILSQLPEETSLEEVASALVAQIGAWSKHPEFIRFLTEALAARRALADRGGKF
jgi:hypothetical protein